jgi:hypothetical protein
MLVAVLAVAPILYRPVSDSWGDQRAEAETSVNTTGSRSRIAELPAETIHQIRTGWSYPFRLAVPA